jgi:hypothetical protein
MLGGKSKRCPYAQILIPSHISEGQCVVRLFAAVTKIPDIIKEGKIYFYSSMIAWPHVLGQNIMVTGTCGVW